MSGFDGTGPHGRGPLTGRGMGFCVLKESTDKLGELEGLVGLQGRPIGQQLNRPENMQQKRFNIPL